jgi:SNF2 family DNA or RNA helicase
LELLKEVIEDIPGEQFIVWTEFVASYNHIKEVLNLTNIRWGEMIGGQNLTTRQKHIDAFQRGELRALVANPKAGGVGVNLQAASAMIYFSRGYSLEDDMQSEARAYRGGSEQHKRILRIDLVTENTIEEDIIEALNKKFSAQELLLTWKGKYGASDGNIKRVIESDVGFVNKGANSALRTGTC